MASYIDWYLIELDRRLHGRIAAEPLFSFVSEVEDHLRLKTEDLTAAGMETEQAERTAVQSFGALDDVALEALDGDAAPVRAARGSLIALIAMCVTWVAAIVISYLGCVPSVVIAMSAVITLAVITFFVSSAISRRWSWRKILLLGAAGAVLTSLALPFGFKPVNGVLMSKVTIWQDAIEQRAEVGTMQTCIDRLQAGLTFYHQLKVAKGDLAKVTLKAPRNSDGSFVVLPEYWSYSPSQLGLDQQSQQYAGMNYTGTRMIYPNYGNAERTASIQVAESSWLERGAPDLVDTQRQIRFGQSRLAALDKAQQAPSGFTISDIVGGLSIGASTSAAFLILNGLAVGLSRGARRWRIRRPLAA